MGVVWGRWALGGGWKRGSQPRLFPSPVQFSLPEEAELLDSERAGSSPLGPSVPRLPFNAVCWRSSKAAPWPEMPWVVGTVLGLLCLICAGVSAGANWRTGARTAEQILLILLI